MDLTEKLNFSSVNKRYSKNLTFVLVIYILILLTGIYGSLLEIDLLLRVETGEGYTDVEIDKNDLIVVTITIFQVLLSLITIVVFLIWFYKTYELLQENSNEKLKLTLAQSVYGFFIPIISFILPFQIMQKIWNGFVQKDAKSKSYKQHIFISFWWIFFIMNCLFALFVFWMSLEQETIKQLIFIAQLNVVKNLFIIIEGILLLIVVFKLTNLIEAFYHQKTITPDELSIEEE